MGATGQLVKLHNSSERMGGLGPIVARHQRKPAMQTTTAPVPTIDAAELTPGSVVSHGTLRSDHLADALLGEIDRLALSQYLPADLAADAQLLATSASAAVAGELPTNDVETIADLFEFLNEAAPVGWCLESLEGDGCEFCWQPVTLTAQLQAVGSCWIGTAWNDLQNEAVSDLINRYDDSPEGLQNFETSDWVNLDEPYTADLLERWETQRADIWALFESYVEAIGATSTLEALEGETLEDPEDMAAAIVNRAMTWAGLELLRELNPDR